MDCQGGGFGDIGTELRAELVHAVGEDGGFVARAGYRDLAGSGVEQIGMDACFGVN